MKVLLLVFGIMGLISTCAVSQAQILLQDNFDSDPANSFPAGWTLLFSGAGTPDQVVNTTHSVSPPNALNLVGSSCFSANAYHPVTWPTNVSAGPQVIVLGGEVYVGQIGTGGCDAFTGRISLWNPSVGSFGTPYAGVEFESDGFIYGVTVAPQPQLMSYSVGQWYKILIEANFTAQTSNIYINDTLVGSNLPFAVTGLPTGVELGAGHGTTPIDWFDNIFLSQNNLNAVPVSGPGPLAVSFSVGYLSPTTTYTLNFGDGTVGPITLGTCIGVLATTGGYGGVQCLGSATHTYANANSYTATLLDASGNTLGIAVIIVSSGSTPTHNAIHWRQLPFR